MIIVINNSNKNPHIKKFVKHFKETKYPLKLTRKTKKNNNYNIKIKSKKCPKDVIELIFTFLKNKGIKYKDVHTTSDILDIIKSGVKVDGIIISGSDLRFSFDKVPYNLILQV